LIGEANKAIEGLSTTNDNYNLAIEKIKRRFGRKQLVIFEHLKALISMPATSNNVGSLRGLFDKFEMHQDNLKSLGIDQNQF
jgi:hypothetical protein